MADLISRKALLEELDKWINPCVNYDKSEFLSGIATAISEVEAAPAVDAAPVVHGRWGEYESFPLTPSLNGCPCSVCKTHFSPSSIIVMKYCPNCGAKMDGGDDND